MAQPSPLATPGPWNLVANSYEQDLVPQFELFAKEALRLTEPKADAVVLDVAAGPGTLALLAAKRVAKVVAVDFAHDMIDRLRARIAREKATNVEARVMDGQRLEFSGDSFDAAYSMFGLMFFPDRLRGMHEILRVLKPGAPAVISSWAPIEKCPIVAMAFGALRAALPDLPGPSTPPPLQDPETFTRVLREAGFDEPRVEVVPFEQASASVDDYWDLFARSSAPIVKLKHDLGEDKWRGVDERARAWLKSELGSDGPFTLGGFANLGFGIKPS